MGGINWLIEQPIVHSEISFTTDVLRGTDLFKMWAQVPGNEHVFGSTITWLLAVGQKEIHNAWNRTPHYRPVEAETVISARLCNT